MRCLVHRAFPVYADYLQFPSFCPLWHPGRVDIGQEEEDAHAESYTAACQSTSRKARRTRLVLVNGPSVSSTRSQPDLQHATPSSLDHWTPVPVTVAHIAGPWVSASQTLKFSSGFSQAGSLHPNRYWACSAVTPTARRRLFATVLIGSMSSTTTGCKLKREASSVQTGLAVLGLPIRRCLPDTSSLATARAPSRRLFM